MTRVALALILAVWLAGEALADPSVRDLTAAGDRHFDLGEYDAAIEKYREAYRLEPLPGLLYNLGQAYRLKGDCVTATLMYRNYLRLDPGTRHRALVDQHLESLAGCAAEQEAAGAIAAAREGSEEVLPPDEAVIADEIVPPPSPESRSAPAGSRGHPGRTRRVAGLASAATGALVVAAGAYFAIDATRAADEVSRGYAEGATWADLEAIDARGRRSEVLGVGLLATGAAALACGATLYALGWRADRRAAHAAIVPSVGGAGVGVSWRF